MPRSQWIGRFLLALGLAAVVPLASTGWAAEPTNASRSASAIHANGPAAKAALPVNQLVATTTPVASGLNRPTAIVAPNDGSGRLFITEKPGRVRVYQPNTGLAATPLLDISGQVDLSGNERGLLGIALPPDFAQTQVLYLAYTRLPDHAVTLSRYSLTSRQLQVLLTQDHSQFSNHNGGQLAFGPDGKLYWGIGDGGGAGDTLGNGQRVTTLLGKILRLDVSRSCGSTLYCIPPDNPFVIGTPGARQEIWAYGLRNPWRFSFDSRDASLWIADVGQGAFEEVDHIAGRQGGANFGWSCKEALSIFNQARCSNTATYTDPVFNYPNPAQGCSVICGMVYHGRQFADLADGTYLATDYCSSTLRALRANPDGSVSSAVIGRSPVETTTFGADANGELYVANDTAGQLHRVSFAQAPR